MADGAVVAAEPHVDAGRLEVGDAGQQFGGSHAVAERDSAGAWHGARRIAVLTQAQVFLAEGEERRLADAAGDHDEVVRGDWRKAVAERAPDVEFVAGAAVGEAMGHLAEREVDDIDRRRARRPHRERCRKERAAGRAADR